MGIPTQKEYEEREARIHAKQIEAVEKATLKERQEGRDAWQEAVVDHPEIIGERISWLLDGCYGYGSMQAARRIADNPRMNRVAGISVMIAALEWNCPAAFAVQVYRKLNADQQERLDEIVRQQLLAYDEERANEDAG